MKKAAAATYLYCLVHGAKQPPLRGIPEGLSGMESPHLLDAGDSLWLVAAAAPLKLYGEAPIESGLKDLNWVAACAVAHERVIEHFNGKGTVIPMKLFTLFTTDSRALQHIKKSRRDLDAVIARVADSREWGVRMRLDEAAALGAVGAKPKPAAKASPGTQFLLRKKKQQDLSRELRERAASDAETAYQELSEYAVDAMRLPIAQPEGGARVTLDAAFLVRSTGEKRFRQAVKRLTTRRPSYEVAVTGPWPPYNFVAKAR